MTIKSLSPCMLVFLEFRFEFGFHGSKSRLIFGFEGTFHGIFGVLKLISTTALHNWSRLT